MANLLPSWLQWTSLPFEETCQSLARNIKAGTIEDVFGEEVLIHGILINYISSITLVPQGSWKSWLTTCTSNSSQHVTVNIHSVNVSFEKPPLPNTPYHLLFFSFPSYSLFLKPSTILLPLTPFIISNHRYPGLHRPHDNLFIIIQYIELAETCETYNCNTFKYNFSTSPVSISLPPPLPHSWQSV